MHDRQASAVDEKSPKRINGAVIITWNCYVCQ